MIRAALGYIANLDAIRIQKNRDDSSNTENAILDANNWFRLFRISYVDVGHQINVVNCLTMENGSPQNGWPPEEFFAYEDDGSPCWFEDEDDRLVFDGSFVFSHPPN